LIYIDPPYNTGNDEFGYNDKFNHSAWLTFMQNRLEVAKDLLADDGVIFVQCDDNEQAYLKILMDDVFGKNQFINQVSVKTKVSSGASGGGEDKKMKKNAEYLLYFCKNRDLFEYSPIYKKILIDEYIAEHKKNDVGFYYTRVLINEGKKKLFKEIDGMKIYKHSDFEFETISNLSKKEKLSTMEVYAKYFNKIFMVTNAQTSILAKVNKIIDEKDTLVSYEYIPKSGKNKNKLISKFVWNETLVVWFADSALIDEKIVYKKEEIGNLWDDISWGRLDLEGGVGLKSGKKPERLLQRIIDMTMNKDDTILDFFAGAGTTGAVAHKMGRRYILVEQMDYIHDLPEARLINVIKGDQTGISEAVGWKGGGSFIYTELLEWNQKYIDRLEKATNGKEILGIYKEIEKEEFYKYKYEPTKFDLKAFKDLDLKDQKKALLDILDMNHLYVNRSSMDDTTFKVEEKDKKLTKMFYEEK
jgi:adenine-specific DNA-methyltransferase